MKFLLSFVIFGLFALASAQEEDDDAMEVGGAIVIDGKEIREKRALGRIYTGSACEYIKLSDITANSGCVDGTKFVIKKDDTVRKQLLIMSGTPILAFVTKNTKFANCSSFTEVTMQVDCKTVDGLSDVDLSANSSSSGGTNNGNALLFPLKTSPVSAYPKFTEVFGVAVFGHSSISDAKFQHVASVLAEWLDNDEDGCADIPLVVSKMTTTSPKPFTWAEKDNGELTSAQVDAFISAGFEPGSVTYNSELLPSCAGVAATENCADATLEEVLHMVTDKGYMPAFPSTFSTAVNSNSLLTAAMDVARGGKFTSIPASYPTSAWFTYNDATCDYRCMATEYVYWGISAYVGSLAGRKNSIANEWKFSTKAELLAGDVKLSAILQDTSSYRAPSVAPDGKYRAPTTCASGAASGGTVA